MFFKLLFFAGSQVNQEDMQTLQEESQFLIALWDAQTLVPLVIQTRCSGAHLSGIDPRAHLSGIDANVGHQNLAPLGEVLV